MDDRPVVHWNLTLTFRDKKQLKKLTKYLIKYNTEFHYRNHHRDGREEWDLTIVSCWGDNLKYIGQIVGKEDRMK